MMTPSLLLVLLAAALLGLLLRHLAHSDERLLDAWRLKGDAWATRHGVALDWANGYYVYSEHGRRYLVVCGRDAFGAAWRYTLRDPLLSSCTLDKQEALDSRPGAAFRSSGGPRNLRAAP